MAYVALTGGMSITGAVNIGDGAVGGGGGGGGGAPGISPDYTLAPLVSGNTTVGSVLTSTTGTWVGDPTITYAYQWQRNGTNISSATSSTYTLVSADEGTAIRCTVTATNGLGSFPANSNTKNIPVAPTGPTSIAIYLNSATGASSFNVAETENPSQIGIQIWAYGSPNAVDVATWTLSGTGITISDFTSAYLYSGSPNNNDLAIVNPITSLSGTIDLKYFSGGGGANIGVMWLGINADNLSEGTEMLTVTVTVGGQTVSDFFNIKDV